MIKRHSRSVDPAKHCCGRCKGKLIEIEVPGSKGDIAMGSSHTPKVARKPSDFALFVKEQSSHVREQLAMERSCTVKEISQALVMKECGKYGVVTKSRRLRLMNRLMSPMTSIL